jgi:hypothetical protein
MAGNDRINARVHRTTRAVVAERLAEERALMRALSEILLDRDRRFRDSRPRRSRTAL